MDFPALTWFLALSLNSCLNPVTRALLENAALPLTTVLSFFVACALREGAVVVLCVVVKSGCDEAGKASGGLART
jgi:hypothetical protein